LPRHFSTHVLIGSGLTAGIIGAHGALAAGFLVGFSSQK